MALLKDEIELSLKLEELFLCIFGLKLSTQRVTLRFVPSLLSFMGRLTMSYLRVGNETSPIFMCAGVCATFWIKEICALSSKLKADEGVFISYSNVSKAFMVFNFSWKTVEDTSHVTFDEDSFIHGHIDHPSSILSELTFSTSNPIPQFFPNVIQPVVPNIDQIVNSHFDSED